MKTLKILFLSTIFLVTLLIASSIGLVSCSDDYDDTVLTTDVTDIQSQLTTDVSDLETKLTTLESIESSLPTMDELNAVAEDATENADDNEAEAIAEAYKADATLLTSINTKIDALETTLTEAIDSKVNPDDVSAADAALLTNVNTKIDAVENTLNEAIDSKVNSDDVNKAITTALNELNISDIRALFAGINNADLVAMKAFVDNWNGTTLPAIIAQITDLGITVKEMITKIDVVKTENYWYWGTVKNDGTFGPNNEIKFTAGQELDTLSMNLIANINPSNADISRYNFSIKNSQGTELPVINLGTPRKYTDILTKSSNFNNMWTIPTTLNWAEIATINGYSSGYYSTPSLYDNNIKSGDDTVRFALTATIKDEYATTDEDKREITSPYDITFDRTAAQPALSDLTLIPTAIIVAEELTGISFSLKDKDTNDLSSFVYKKYITAVDKNGDEYPDGTFPGINTLSNLNDPIVITYNLDKEYKDTVYFTIHYLNFDGTTGTATFNLPAS